MRSQKLWLISCDNRICKLSWREMRDMNISWSICKLLIIHDALGNLSQSHQLCIKKSECRGRDLYHFIMDSFEVASDRRDRRPDLMREIRKEVWADFFLKWEGLIQSIYHLCQRRKFILFSIGDMCILFLFEDISEILRDHCDGAEEATNPEEIREENNRDPYEIQDNHSEKNITNKSLFVCDRIKRISKIIKKTRWHTESTKYLLSTHFDPPRKTLRAYSNHCIRGGDIIFWIFRDIIEIARISLEIPDNILIFETGSLIESVRSDKHFQKIRVRCTRPIYLRHDITRVFWKKLINKDSKSENIHEQGHDQYKSSNEWDGKRKSHSAEDFRRKTSEVYRETRKEKGEEKIFTIITQNTLLHRNAIVRFILFSCEQTSHEFASLPRVRALLRVRDRAHHSHRRVTCPV